MMTPIKPFLTLALVLLISGCREMDVCTPRSHVFEVNCAVQPIRTTYAVGDTLNVQLFYDEKILDIQSGNRYLLPRDYLYLTNIRIRFADSLRNDNTLGAMMDSIVTVLNLDSLSVNHNSSLIYDDFGNSKVESQLILDPVDSVYSITYRVKFNEPGTYVLVNRINIGDQDLFGRLEIDGVCEGASISPAVTLNENAQTNFSLLEGTEVPFYINVLIDRSIPGFDDTGSFVFRVEE